MTESSAGGETPPKVERDTSTGQSNQRSNRNRRNSTSTQRETRFEESCEDLKGSVYDMTAGKDTFLKTTRKIAEYVGREYTDAGEYRLAMINLNLPALVEPQLPTDVTNMMAVEIWKLARCTFDKKTEARDRNKQRIYALTLGQCSHYILISLLHFYHGSIG
jgi:hypothetical protein